MYLPQIDDERATLCGFLEVQLDAIRAAAYGLDDAQARQSPVRSVLSISGILKHSIFIMKQSLSGAGHREHDQPQDAFYRSFAPADDESLEQLTETFDTVRSDYMKMCREGDLEAVLPVGPMPWFNMNEPREAKLRYLYVHHVEEFARHAGHADIIREQIDGAKAGELMFAVEGQPGNEFISPWKG